MVVYSTTVIPKYLFRTVLNAFEFFILHVLYHQINYFESRILFHYFLVEPVELLGPHDHHLPRLNESVYNFHCSSDAGMEHLWQANDWTASNIIGSTFTLFLGLYFRTEEMYNQKMQLCYVRLLVNCSTAIFQLK